MAQAEGGGPSESCLGGFTEAGESCGSRTNSANLRTLPEPALQGDPHRFCPLSARAVHRSFSCVPKGSVAVETVQS